MIKLSDKCPEVSVKRKPGTDDEYIVKVNGEIIPIQYNEGGWSRHIFLAPQYGVVIKIDEDYYAQSRNEVVFWTERVKGRDKRFFAPILGWGTTSVKVWGWRHGSNHNVKKQKRVFYCVQEYIAGAKEYDAYTGNRRKKVDEEYGFIADIVVQDYNMSDFHFRQLKINSKGRIKIHDYGLFHIDLDTSDLPSDRIPVSANVAARNMNKILEKIGA